jgi:hypothetical protein
MVALVVPLLIVTSRRFAVAIFLVPAAAFVAVASMPFSVVVPVSSHLR